MNSHCVWQCSTVTLNSRCVWQRSTVTLNSHCVWQRSTVTLNSHCVWQHSTVTVNSHCVWQHSTVTLNSCISSKGNVTNLLDAAGLYCLSGIQTVAQNVGLWLLLSCYSKAISITLNSIMTSAQRVDHLWEVVVQLGGRSDYWVLHHSRICWHLLYAVTLFYLYSVLRLFRMMAVVQCWLLFQSAVSWGQHI
jgi:hypothetical protein